MKKISLIVITVFLAVMFFTSCGLTSNDNQEISNENQENSIRNLDSSIEVAIGKQVWMTQNLNVVKFRNGDPIPEAKTAAEWETAGNNGQPAWCFYENKPANGVKYGKLYNWYAVYDPRGLAPSGFHVPSDDEWTTLINYLGGEKIAGKKMKSKSNWFDSGNGSNSSGFLGLPGGSRNTQNKFIGIGFYGSYWCSNEVDDANRAWSLGLSHDSDGTMLDYRSLEDGLSVRCLRD
jgi:uncharacterized protein (TIGR02145 family)